MQPHRLAAQGSLLAVASLWLFIGLLSIEYLVRLVARLQTSVSLAPLPCD